MVRMVSMMETQAIHQKSQLHNTFLHNNNRLVLECRNRIHKCTLATCPRMSLINNSSSLRIKTTLPSNNEVPVTLCHHRLESRNNTLTKHKAGHVLRILVRENLVASVFYTDTQMPDT